MSPGRLIRVRRYRGDPNVVVYIVASHDAAGATEAAQKKHEEAGSDIEDLGRVSDAPDRGAQADAWRMRPRRRRA